MAKVQRRKLRERARTERMRLRRTQDRELHVKELSALTAVGALASEILQLESTRERAAIALLRSQEQGGVIFQRENQAAPPQYVQAPYAGASPLYNPISKTYAFSLSELESS